MIGVGDIILVKEPLRGSWVGFLPSTHPEKYDYHSRIDVTGPQLGVVLDVAKWHIKLLLQKDSMSIWLPLHALEELQSERTM